MQLEKDVQKKLHQGLLEMRMNLSVISNQRKKTLHISAVKLGHFPVLKDIPDYYIIIFELIQNVGCS